MATAAYSKVEMIILTGGVAYPKMLTDWIKSQSGTDRTYSAGTS